MELESAETAVIYGSDHRGSINRLPQVYDSKMRYKPQVNLLYIFTLGENTGYPVYYKQYPGSTLDISAFSDILKEATVYADNCTVIADNGFASEDDFSLLEECGMKYVIPLKRGNRFVKGHVPPSPFGYML